MRTTVPVLCLATLLAACGNPCDATAFDERGAALVAELDDWSPESGRVSDFSTRAVSVIWNACQGAVHDGFRGYLDKNAHHPVPPWVVEARPAPADPEAFNPLEAVLPGHRKAHAYPFNGKDPNVMKWVERVCANPVEVGQRVMSAEADERARTVVEGCGLDSVPWIDTEEYLATGPAMFDLVGIAMRNYVVASGASPAIADPVFAELVYGIHRPLEHPHLGQALQLEDIELPHAAAAPVVSVSADAVVYITRSSVSLVPNPVPDNGPLANRAANGLTVLDADHRSALAFWISVVDERVAVLLVADRNAPTSLVRDVASTLTKARPLPAVKLAVLVDAKIQRIRTLELPDPRAGEETVTVQALLDRRLGSDRDL